MKEIYGEGARRIAVFSVPPLGYLPSQRTIGGGIQRNVVVKINDAVRIFNAKLSKQLDSLNQNFQDSKIVYIDVYNPLLDIIVNYQKYGNFNFHFFLFILIYRAFYDKKHSNVQNYHF